MEESEDSSKLDTSFIKQLNLTIRLGAAYLFRRTICHAGWQRRLEDPLELLRRHDNFVRPHRALKLGAEIRPRAMLVGLVSRRFGFRGVFMAEQEEILFVIVSIDVTIDLNRVREQRMPA